MLSATIICKNEEKLIRRCLDSLTELDEIVVCDTGSTDGTIEIVHDFAALAGSPPVILCHHTWHDHFADARNDCLKSASGDWCLVIDCDEILVAGSVAALKQAIAATEARTLRAWCVPEGGNEATGHWMVRAHKRVPDIVWKNRAHNVLSEDSRIEVAGFKIIYGYSPAHKADPERTLRMLARADEEEPGNPRTLYYLAREYFYRREWAKAEELFAEQVARDPFVAQAADGWLYLAKCRWEQHRGDKARQACLQAIGINPHFKEALNFMATLSFPDNAVAWRRYAEQATNQNVLFVRG